MTEGEANAVAVRAAAFLSRVQLGGPLGVRARVITEPAERSAGLDYVDVFLEVRAVVPNAVAPSSVTVLHMSRDLELLSHVSDGEFDWMAESLLWSAVRELYLHEAAEWYVIDGVRVHDPHRGRTP